MKKRNFKYLFALMLLLFLLPAAAFAADGNCTGDHSGMTAWNDPESMPTAAGRYYLADDVTLEWAWEPVVDMTLCLNGHTISVTGEHRSVIEVEKVRLTLCDCQDTGKAIGNSTGIGVSSGGALTVYGGTITGKDSFGISNQANLYLYGGTIRDCRSAGVLNMNGSFEMHGGWITNNNDGGVWNSGDFAMYGGRITDNRSESCGGIRQRGDGALLSGEIQITGNTLADIVLRSGRLITVEDLITTAPLTVFMATPGTFTTNDASAYLDCFTSIDPAYVVEANEDGTLALVPVLEEYDVILPTGEGYTITSDSPNPVTEGGSYTFTVTVDEGYDAIKLVVKANGVSLFPDNGRGQYTITDITADQTITVEGVNQKIVYHPVTLDACEGVTISGPTSNLVPEGNSYTFAVHIDEGYNWDNMEVTVNGEVLTPVDGKYTIPNITAPQNIVITGVEQIFSITYELNGGSDDHGNPTQYRPSDGEITLTAPTYCGHIFMGWYTTPDFQEGTEVTSIPTGSTGDLVLYAKWEKMTYIQWLLETMKDWLDRKPSWSYVQKFNDAIKDYWCKEAAKWAGYENFDFNWRNGMTNRKMSTILEDYIDYMDQIG